MEAELKELELQRQNAINIISNVETRIDELRKIIQPSYVRDRLSRWIDLVLKYYYLSDNCTKEYADIRNLVYIPINECNKEYQCMTYRDRMNNILENLKKGNILSLFQGDHDYLHTNDTYIDILVTNEEYMHLLPTEEEKPWFILCGIRIIRNSYTQYIECIPM